MDPDLHHPMGNGFPLQSSGYVPCINRYTICILFYMPSVTENPFQILNSSQPPLAGGATISWTMSLYRKLKVQNSFLKRAPTPSLLCKGMVLGVRFSHYDSDVDVSGDHVSYAL